MRLNHKRHLLFNMTRIHQTPNKESFSRICHSILSDLRGVDWTFEPAALAGLRSAAQIHLRQLLKDKRDVQNTCNRQPTIKLSQRLYITPKKHTAKLQSRKIQNAT